MDGAFLWNECEMVVVCEWGTEAVQEAGTSLYRSPPGSDTRDAGSRCAASRQTGYRRHSACLLMQTRFRSPHLPPGKRQMPLFSGRPRTKNLQPSLYVFAEQHGEETVLPHGTHKKPVFSIYIGHPQWLTLTIPRFLQVCPRSYWHRAQ